MITSISLSTQEFDCTNSTVINMTSTFMAQLFLCCIVVRYITSKKFPIYVWSGISWTPLFSLYYAFKAKPIYQTFNGNPCSITRLDQTDFWFSFETVRILFLGLTMMLAFKVLISLIFFNREVTGRQRIGMMKLLAIVLFDYTISVSNSALHIFQAFNFTNIPMIHYLLGVLRCVLVPVLFLMLHEGIRRAFLKVVQLKMIDTSSEKKNQTKSQLDMKKSSSIEQLNEVRSRIRQEMDGFSPLMKTSSGASTPRREFGVYETKSSPKRFEV